VRGEGEGEEGAEGGAGDLVPSPEAQLHVEAALGLFQEHGDLGSRQEQRRCWNVRWIPFPFHHTPAQGQRREKSGGDRHLPLLEDDAGRPWNLSLLLVRHLRVRAAPVGEEGLICTVRNNQCGFAAFWSSPLLTPAAIGSRQCGRAIDLSLRRRTGRHDDDSREDGEQ
jgi:hypothetical protein